MSPKREEADAIGDFTSALSALGSLVSAAALLLLVGAALIRAIQSAPGPLG